MRIVLISITALLLVCGSHATAGELHDAVRKGDLAAVKTLLAKGADINAKEEALGGTPLYWAAMCNQLNIVKVLLAKGADINARDLLGGTPLHVANQVNIAEVLLANGADINAKDKHGKTPLYVSVDSNEVSLEMIRFLVAKGADINAGNDNIGTPLDCCANAPLEWADDESDLEQYVSAGAFLAQNGAVFWDFTKAEMQKLHRKYGSWEELMWASIDAAYDAVEAEHRAREDEVGPTHIKTSGFLFIHSERTYK